MGIRRDQFSSFLARYLQMIGEEIPSDWARLVLVGGAKEIVMDRCWPARDEDRVAETEKVLRQAVEERRPLILENSQAAKSDVCRGGFSYLCLPFFIAHRPVGAICLRRDSGQTPYSPEDLEWLFNLSSALAPLLKSWPDCRFEPGPDIFPRSSDMIIGTSQASRFIQTLIDKVKDNDAPVFITGESGTGKELIARAIHERGARRAGPFVAVNCGAIPDPLLESELFGHTRGAFTGALRDKAGLIEEANRGTFFLDEIGDLPLPLQSKLLRLLQEKELRRIGETRTRRVDVRFISATNKNIESEIERGNFRADLYYRLRILAIEVPPLRDRKGDLLLLINHFVEKYCLETKRERTYFSPHALELLIYYSWPGNVRELQNEIQRCLILAGKEELIKEEHLSPKINPQRETSSPVSYNYFEAKSDFEKRFLNQALHRFGYNKARTAEEVGLSRQGLFKLMKKHKISSKLD